HPILRPRVPPAGVEFLVLQLGRLVDFLRVEGGVDVPQERDDVGICVADAANLEVVLVHVDNVQMILPDPHLAQASQFGARAFQELQRGVGIAFSVDMRRQWYGHAPAASSSSDLSGTKVTAS